MRSVLSLVSLFAVGLMIASAVAILAMRSGVAPIGMGNSDAFLDMRSLSIGLVLGLSLSQLAKISWAELPHRIVSWLWANERNFYRAALAILLLGIVIFY